MCKGRCYAYDDLKEQLHKHCQTYRLLHENREFGRGRYSNEKGELFPDKDISELIRGGIISSLAIFEEFLGNIFNETFERICYKHECTCNCTCSIDDSKNGTDDSDLGLNLYKEEPVSGEEEPVSGEEEPVSGEEEPVSDEKEPVSDVKEPVSGEKEPVSGEKEPVSDEKEPVFDVKEPVSVKVKLLECKCDCKKKLQLKESTDQQNSKLFKDLLQNALNSRKETNIMVTLLTGVKSTEELLIEYKNSILGKGVIPTLHGFKSLFQNLFAKSTMNILFNNELPLIYLFLLDNSTHSKIEIKDDQTLCAIMRLWYGIRCVSAHGVPDRTFKTEVLKSFSKCGICSNEEIPILSKCKEFCDITDKMGLTPDDMDKADSNDEKRKLFVKVKRYPNASVFVDHCKKLQPSNNDAKHALSLIKENWKSPTPGSEVEYPSEFGFYQLYRIYTYFKIYKRTQYMTYRLFVRINLFLLIVAFRIKVAVAKCLTEMDKSQDLKNLWGFKKDPKYLKALFKDEGKKHKQAIEEIKSLSKSH